MRAASERALIAEQGNCFSRQTLGDHRKSEGDHTSSISRRELASKPGMSKHQQTQAVRIASLPRMEFEKAVEGPRIPTLTALVGKSVRIQPPKAEPASPITSEAIRDLTERHVAASLINALVRVDHGCDPAVFFEVLFDEKNVAKLPAVRLGMRTIMRLKAELDQTNPRGKPNLKAGAASPSLRQAPDTSQPFQARPEAFETGDPDGTLIQLDPALQGLGQHRTPRAASADSSPRWPAAAAPAAAGPPGCRWAGSSPA